jgi:hypothetical protein
MAEKIQPMVLSGRRATMMAPTTMKALKASSRPAWLAGASWKMPLRAIRT